MRQVRLVKIFYSTFMSNFPENRPSFSFATEGGDGLSDGQPTQLNPGIPAETSFARRIAGEIGNVFSAKILRQPGLSSTSTHKVSPEDRAKLNQLQREIRTRAFLDEQRELNPNFLNPNQQEITTFDS